MKKWILFFLLGLIFTVFGWGQQPELVVQTGHKGMSAAAFSPDGKYILIGGGGRIPKLWDLSGLEIQSFIGHRHDNIINSVAFSPDGTRVLTADKYGRCILWDLQGQMLSSFQGCNSTSFSPDGQSILTIDSDGAILLWDLYGRELQRFEGHRHGIFQATFSPDGQKILSGDGFGVVRLWDLQGRVRELQSSRGTQGYIQGLSFSPDGKVVWAAEYKGSIKSWDLQGRELYGFEGANDKTISWAVFSPDGERAVVQSFAPFKGRTTKLWSLNGRELLDFQDPDVSSATFSPDGRMVLTTRNDGTALLWDLQGKKLQTFEGHRSSVNSVAFSPAGDRILMGNEDGTARLFDLRNLSLQSFKGHENAVTSAVFSPDGKTVLTGSMDATARLWNLTGQEILQTPGHEEAVWSVAFSPDGQKILVGSGEQYGVATLWNLQGEKIHSLENHGSAVTSVAFSPNGQKMLTGSLDETAKLWDLQGRELRTFKYDSGLLSGAFSPNGQYVAAGSTTGWNARLWDLQGNELQSFEGHLGFINSIAFSPDGQSILTGSVDMTAKLWGLDGREVRSFEGHKEAVTSALFSPDSKLLLTGSGDGTARLTDSNTGEMLVTLYAISDVKDLWLLVNPENYYMGSRDIQGFVHFKIGLKPYLFEQFDLRLNRPDKVLESLNPYGVVDSLLMLQYRQAYHKRLEKYGFTEAMLSDDYHVPECAITNADQLPITTKEGMVKLQIEALDTLRLLDRFNVYVNDVPIYGIQGINLRQENTQSYNSTLNIPLSRGPNKIQVSVLNQGGAESLKATHYITYNVPKIKPNLYLVVIGVSDYRAEGKDLKYAAKDARDIAEWYQSAPGFGKIYSRILTDAKASKANILALHQWLESTGVDDQVLLYVSGHGLIDDNYDFYYATHDIDFENPAGKGILYDEIEGLLDGIPARKKLLLLDACHSGEFDEEAPPLTAEEQQSLAQKGVSFKGFTKGDDEGGPTLGLQNSFELMQQLFADLRRGSGATVITSSAGVQVSYEDKEWQNGAFTYAFLYGLKSMQADANGDGQVTASEIQAFVAEYVPRLTEGLQVPTFRRENLEFDFSVW